MNDIRSRDCLFNIRILSHSKEIMEIQTNHETCQIVKNQFFNNHTRIFLVDTNGHEFVLNSDYIEAIEFINTGSPDHHNINL